MEYRSLPLAAVLILLGLISAPLSAEEEIGTPEQRADWAQRLEKARVMSAEADAREQEAAQLRAGKDAACPQRFRVNACYEENRDNYTRVAREVRRLDNEARTLEREVRREQAREKEIRREADAARHVAGLPEREAETSAARQKAADREAAIRADKAQKAEIGLQRKAAETDKLRQKQAAHDARVAEKLRKASVKATPDGTGKP